MTHGGKLVKIILILLKRWPSWSLKKSIFVKTVPRKNLNPKSRIPEKFPSPVGTESVTWPPPLFLYYCSSSLFSYNTLCATLKNSCSQPANTCQKLLLRNNTPQTIDQESTLSPDNPQNISWQIFSFCYNNKIEIYRKSCVVSIQHIIIDYNNNNIIESV